jgi:hypothetical protein
MSCLNLKPIFYLNFQISFSFIVFFLVTSTEKLNSNYYSWNIGISMNSESQEKQTSRLSLSFSLWIKLKKNYFIFGPIDKSFLLDFLYLSKVETLLMIKNKTYFKFDPNRYLVTCIPNRAIAGMKSFPFSIE